MARLKKELLRLYLLYLLFVLLFDGNAFPPLLWLRVIEFRKYKGLFLFSLARLDHCIKRVCA